MVDTSRLGIRTRIEMALWFAVVFGFLEVLGLAIKANFFGDFIDRGRDFVWMTPAAYAIVTLAATAALATISFVWVRAGGIKATVWVQSFAGVLSVMIAVGLGWIHIIAIVLLTAGIATRIMGSIGIRRKQFERMVHRSTVWLVAGTVAVGVGARSLQAIDVRVQVSRLPTALAGAPNVLLIILDTVRGANLSLYGYGRPTTPNLDRLAEESTVFDRAVAPSSWTLPSHASIFTGRTPSDLSVDWYVPLDDSYPTLAEVLVDNGYVTAGFVANRDYATREQGLDRGFIEYQDFGRGFSEILLSSGLTNLLLTSPLLRPLVGSDDRFGLKRAATIRRDFVRWVRRHDDRPFFAFLNFYDAHEPYLPPDPWYGRFGQVRTTRLSHYARKAPGQSVPRETVDSAMAAYDASIAYLDNQIGLLIDELRELGISDNTLVIITSDHGEEFARFGLLRHGHSLYPGQLWVPLLMFFPNRIPRGRRVAQPVSLMDIPQTIFDLVDVRSPPSFEGKSLARAWRDALFTADPVLSEVTRNKAGPPTHPTTHGAMRSLIVDWLQVIAHEAGVVESFDWSTSAFERVGTVPQGFPTTP